MRRSRIAILMFVATSAIACGLALPSGCSAAPNGDTGVAGAGAATSTGGTGGTAGAAGSPSGGGGEGGIFDVDGGPDAKDDATANPCGTECGAKELCDPEHVGTDDNCNGLVDETCDCAAGVAHSCFKGDPSYLATPGCFPGTMKCTENGNWGPCLGGVHATPEDNCFMNDGSSCHPLSAVPFQNIDLKVGTGSFSAGAEPGTEVWTVECPPGVSPCPAVGGMAPMDDFKPLQSGEYKVTYTKGLPGGATASCEYPLFVGAPGLRVELSWEHDLGGDGVDLDLHLHQPQTTTPWSFDGDKQDCSWTNCTITQFKLPSGGPDWFDGAAPPDPVDWFLDPIPERNTCYYAPHGKGQEWQALGKGCHNPRIDLDNIQCDPLVLDVEDDSFCAPENANVDYPPIGKWFRLGVHYFSNHALGYDVHPRLLVFCEGALAADLGPGGFYDPESPVTFPAIDGSGGPGGNVFWLAADVAFVEGSCGTRTCVVRPLYADAATRTPLLTKDFAAELGFGPSYAPAP
ncbi:MAG: hypothetical protein R3B70_17750 [Polyangiaceae bacterium]